MEQFKDIERENKTKPHSKQGLSAEEKLDPREKEKADTVEWLQVMLLAVMIHLSVTIPLNLHQRENNSCSTIPQPSSFTS